MYAPISHVNQAQGTLVPSYEKLVQVGQGRQVSAEPTLLKSKGRRVTYSDDAVVFTGVNTVTGVFSDKVDAAALLAMFFDDITAVDQQVVWLGPDGSQDILVRN